MSRGIDMNFIELSKINLEVIFYLTRSLPRESHLSDAVF